MRLKVLTSIMTAISTSVVNGELDIASNDPLVKILKNNGNGTFAPAD